jgi:hypothetical protein
MKTFNKQDTHTDKHIYIRRIGLIHFNDTSVLKRHVKICEIWQFSELVSVRILMF